MKVKGKEPHLPRHCPNCKVDFRGEPIPKQLRRQYGGRTYFYRVRPLRDKNTGITAGWACPDCRHQWAREATITIS